MKPDAARIRRPLGVLWESLMWMRLLETRARGGWLFLALLFVLVGAFPPNARGQKITVTANASATGSATVNEPTLGKYEDNVTISAQALIVMQPATNRMGVWVITSSNYSVSVSGSGSDDANGQSWTETEANPDEGFYIYLDFDSTLDNIPFVGGQAQFEIGEPWVDVSPSTVTDSQDGLSQALFAWNKYDTNGPITVPTNNQAFTISGGGHQDAIPIVGLGVSETGSFDVNYTVSYQPGSTNLSIVSVQTPTTVNGNQHTFISTDTITLKASIGSGKSGIPVGWSVLGLNGASPPVVTNGVVNTQSGGISTFTFSPSQISAFVQFRRSNFTNGSEPEAQPNTPLSFDVAVSAQGQETRLSQSGLGTLMQDETDTLRQEYVDYRTIYRGSSFTPQRADVVPSLGGRYNTGNYGVQLSRDLDSTFQEILQAYQVSTITFGGVTAALPDTATITVNSGFRNPQRNKAVGSKYPQTSIHMFGGALDLKPVPTWVLINGQRTWANIDQILYPALQQAAATQGTAFAEFNAIPVPLGSDGSLTNSNGTPIPKENHIHVQW